jgi:hypothetical protein
VRRECRQYSACSDRVGGSWLVDEIFAGMAADIANLAAALEAIHWRFESTQMAAFVRNAASVALGADTDRNITAARWS